MTTPTPTVTLPLTKAVAIAITIAIFTTDVDRTVLAFLLFLLLCPLLCFALPLPEEAEGVAAARPVQSYVNETSRETVGAKISSPLHSCFLVITVKGSGL